MSHDRYRVFWMLLLLLCWVSLAGCPKDKDKAATHLPVYEIKVRVLGQTVAGTEPGTIRQQVIQLLKKGGLFALNKKKKPGAYQLAVDVGLRPDGEQLVVLVAVNAKAHTDGLTEAALPLQANALAKVKASSDKQRAARVVGAVKQAIKDVEFQGRLSIATETQITKVLDSEKDLHRLGATIEIIAIRRVKRAVPRLIKLLDHEKTEISDRAIGALIAIGDRRAVKPLTRLAKFDDTERLAKVIDGIGSLGGKEAKEFLEFTAVGHEDADIRNLAREALERMTKATPKKSGR